jgi:hypothetical protein
VKQPALKRPTRSSAGMKLSSVVATVPSNTAKCSH